MGGGTLVGRGREGGREMGEIVDANTIRTASNIYVYRSSRQSYAPPPPPPGRVYVPSKINTSRSWWNSAETKRKKRVARYKLYAVEGKVKYSVKHGFRWIKNTCSRMVHGF